MESECETVSPGPARRVFSVTKLGRRVVQRCAEKLRQRTEVVQSYLDALSGEPLDVVEDDHRKYEVLVEAKLSVSAEDEASARRKVEEALAVARRVDADVWSTGHVWLYEATEGDAEGH